MKLLRNPHVALDIGAECDVSHYNGTYECVACACGGRSA